MSTGYLLQQLSDATRKFKDFFCHKKKLKALENYSATDNCKHRSYLQLIRECMRDGFLDQKEAEFLDHMLNKYEINYLDWAHRTKWVKNEINRLAKPKPTGVVFQMDWIEKKPATYTIPLHLLAANKTGGLQKRI